MSDNNQKPLNHDDANPNHNEIEEGRRELYPGEVEEEEVITTRRRRVVDNSTAIPAEEYGNDELPDLNRKAVGGTLLKVLLFCFGLAAAGYMLYMVNSPKKVKEPDKNVTVSNNLPPLAVDSEPAKPIGVVNAKGPVEAPQKNKPLDWWDRKRFGQGSQNENAGGAYGERREKQDIDQNGFTERCDPLLHDNCKHRSELGAKLEPTTFKVALAGFMPDRNYLITSSTALDATLDTAIDSSEPGIIKATLTKDVFSDNNQVKLLERGSQVDGQYSGSVKPGNAKLFVIWTRIRTPNGVWINIDSPGADALGRSGMSGQVDNRFWDRFGAAFLLSIFKDTSAYARNRVQNNGNSNQLTLDNSGNAINTSVEKRLEVDANIPPVLTKNQGDHIQIMVARDLDFSPVYRLALKKND